jgi:hypothetical protein
VQSPEELAWERSLEEMEARVNEIAAALEGSGRYPGEFAIPTPGVPLPRALRPRARHLLGRQRELESLLRERVEAYGRFIFGGHEDSQPTGRSVNLRI